MGPEAMIFIFWMLNFKPTFSLSSFTFIKRLFSSSSLSATRVMSSAYLRLLIFLLAILILACATYGPAFLMMYSAYKLNKQGDNIQPWHTPFRIWNQSVVPCPVLTVASWPAYKFLRRQVRWSGIPISFRIFHSSLWSTQSKALARSIKQKYHYHACMVVHALPPHNERSQKNQGHVHLLNCDISTVYHSVLGYSGHQGRKRGGKGHT